MDPGADFENAIVFRGKPITNILSTSFFILLTAFFAWMISFTDRPANRVIYFIGVLISLMGDVYAIRSICRGRRIMVAIGERGIFDWRISDKWIPWEAITRIDKGMNPSLTKLFINFLDALWVRVKPGFAATFREKLFSRLMRVGMVGYRVVLMGVDAKDQFLRRWIATVRTGARIPWKSSDNDQFYVPWKPVRLLRATASNARSSPR